MLFSTILLYLTLLVCAVLIGAAVIRYDLYDREPLRMILLATALGALGMHLAGVAQVAMIARVNAQGGLVSNVELAVMAGVSEELSKFAVVLALLLLARRHLNEPLDGLIYGSFAGLGAALDESLVILRDLVSTGLLPGQEPVRLAGHLVMGGIGAAGLGLFTRPHAGLPSRPTGLRAGLIVIAGLLGAIALHTVWDIVAFEVADHGRSVPRGSPSPWWHTAAPIAMMVLGMGVYRWLVAWSARLSRPTGLQADAQPARTLDKGPRT